MGDSMASFQHLPLGIVSAPHQGNRYNHCRYHRLIRLLHPLLDHTARVLAPLVHLVDQTGIHHRHSARLLGTVARIPGQVQCQVHLLLPYLRPLSGTFPVNGSHPQPHSHNRTTSFSKSNSNGSDQLTLPTSNPSDLSNGVPSTKPNRRHSRLHSRNLSIFFPRPGSLPESSISEDGTQEIQVHIDEEAPVTDMPSAGSSAPYAEHKQKLKGFTFGGKPSPDSDGSTPSSATSTSRRGHHHKHSVSHNFFSFLEPGSQGDPSDLHTQPTPIPVSPWNPISPFPDSAASTKTAFSPTANGVGHQHDHEHDHDHDHDHAHSHGPKSPNAIFHYEPTGPRIAPSAVAATIGQFLLGAWLWVSGQQIGSLSCTGLGYWVVFDSFGVGLTTILPKYLSKKSLQSKIKRPYG